ncbi:MAG: thermonuclease family protein [Parvularculaceae bacterium]
MRRRGFLTGVMALGAAPLHARANGPDGAALSGDRFMQAGAEMRLADILAPATVGLAGGAEPFAEDARRALAGLLAAGPITLSEAGKPDRWGRRVVIARDENGRSLQEKLIRAGAARVAPETDEAEFIDALLAREREARIARRGLWLLDHYRVRNALDANDAIGGYHLVEGVVWRAAKARGRIYLNFGADYRTDFTVTARSVLARRWAKAGFDLLAFEGARVRARGFVERINGPSLALSHPKQIERV